MTETELTEPSNEEGEFLPSISDFFLRTPLYQVFNVNSGNAKQIQSIENFNSTLDAYCIYCREQSIFHNTTVYRYGSGKLDAESVLRDKVFTVKMACSRNGSHTIHFFFRIYEKAISKIGQYPSIADFHFSDIEKYRSILGSEKYKELARAHGLSTHGVGIGAYVYLRRIFESLIEEAHQIALIDSNWDEENFSNARMEEKIHSLKFHLPKFLVLCKANLLVNIVIE
ncbi:hypothetical protein [Candidatus Leptofilum sp.]|uniref:hypothetical protein n=1 Tax=Candidatus Leptofilum sp. TaxID=3241576 RepID=UPI003B5A2069